MAAEDQATPTGRTQLRDLVRERKAELGLSYDKLAERCVDPKSGEQTVKSSWLHRLVSGLAVQPPDVPQLRGMAAGLDVPLGLVQEAAAAEFFGLDTVWSDDRAVRTLVHRYEEMDPEDQRRVQALIETYRATGRSADPNSK